MSAWQPSGAWRPNWPSWPEFNDKTLRLESINLLAGRPWRVSLATLGPYFCLQVVGRPRSLLWPAEPEVAQDERAPINQERWAQLVAGLRCATGGGGGQISPFSRPTGGAVAAEGGNKSA